MLFPTQVSYSRTNVGWHMVPKATLAGEGSESLILGEGARREDFVGRLVDPGSTNHPPPSAIIARLFSNEYEEKQPGE